MKTLNARDISSFKSGSGDLKLLLTERTVGAKNAMMGHGRLEPGAIIPVEGEVSVHAGEEYDYILSGRIAVWVEGEERVLGPGDAIYIDAGQRHIFRNAGPEPAEFIWVLSPGIKL